MKFCPSCGTQNNESANFCINCGKKIQFKAICPNCNQEINPNDTFCVYCGKNIKEQTIRKQSKKLSTLQKVTIIFGSLVLLLVILFLSLFITNPSNIFHINKSIPDGWLQLKTDNFSIYMPDSWAGGSARELATIIKTQLQITSTETTNSNNKSLFVFWAYDTASSLEDIPITFNVIRVTSSISSLKDYMDKSYKNIEVASNELDSNYKTLEQQILKMGSYDQVARTITSQELLGNNLSIVQYIIKDGTIYWIMTFSANQKDFDANIDKFDRAIQTTVLK